MEPLTTPNPDKFSKKLGLIYKGSNINGKIWIFVEEGANFEVGDDSEQLLHGRLTCPRLPTPIEISPVYAKCARGERLALWDKMRDITQMSEGRPWFIGGDFNTILSTRDRTRSDTNRQVEMVDFAEAIEDCRLLDPGFDGSDYTWAKNGLMERLDRVLNREVFGNIHANLKACEENIVVAQSEFEGDPSARNRMEINKQIAEYVLLLKMEEDFWHQKAALHWLEEGDKNTRFYQSWVKQKRIRLRIHKINANGRELTHDLEIRDSAVEFYQNLLAPTCPELAAPRT
ncbi:uncharacterized protein LOC121749479 [Salvia splendens]|uniref:uncharacterized protein LOC121749479 n=1 Tax=Salvia splendens TaxID=180675 RepID=UPI001C260E97|nr:uncharacterized protein LOC121749479 [Salvia splendens]